MTLKLVKGEFSSLEEALRAQVVMMQARIEELEFSRDQWRSMYEQTLTIAVQATDHE